MLCSEWPTLSYSAQRGAATASGSYLHCPPLPGPVTLTFTENLVMTATTQEAVITLCPQVPDLCLLHSSSRDPAMSLRVRRRGVMPRVASYPVTARTGTRAVSSRPTISNTTLRCLLKRTLIPMWPGFTEGEGERGTSASGPRSRTDVSPRLSSCPELGFQDPPRTQGRPQPGLPLASQCCGLSPPVTGSSRGRHPGLIVSCPPTPGTTPATRKTLEGHSVTCSLGNEPARPSGRQHLL